MLSFLQNYKECSEKHWKLFSKILIRGLQKYWEVFCKNIWKCSVEILSGVFCKNIEKSSAKLLRRVPDLNADDQIPFKNTRTWSVFCYIMAFYFWRPRYNKQLLRARSFANFLYLLNHDKGDTGDRRVIIYRYAKMKLMIIMINGLGEWRYFIERTPPSSICHFR